MRSKTLGRTGLDVSIVGLGTAFLGMSSIHATHAPYEDLIRDIDEDLGFLTVVAALEAGVVAEDVDRLDPGWPEGAQRHRLGLHGRRADGSLRDDCVLGVMDQMFRRILHVLVVDGRPSLVQRIA